jgi:diguanylate cyclase (GGDEF)-like protein/PAS domain S-box-containing protein
MPKFCHTLDSGLGRRRFLYFAAFYIASWVATWYSASVLESISIVSLWYLPAGLRFFCLLVFGWAGVAIELAVQAVFALTQLAGIKSTPIVAYLSADALWRLYNLLCSLVINAAIILPSRRWLGGIPDFSKPAHNVWFVFAAAGASALSALGGTYGKVQLGFIKPQQFADVATSWMIGDFIGIAMLTPLLLVRLWPGLKSFLERGIWYVPEGSRWRHSPPDLYTAIVVICSLLAIFVVPWQLGLAQHFPLLALLLLLPLAGVAWRYGSRRTVVAVIVLDSGLVVLISYFGRHEQAMQYQIVMLAIALVGLWLGGAVDALNRIVGRYRDFAGIANDLLWEADRQGCLIEASGHLASELSLARGDAWLPSLAGQDSDVRTELERRVAARQSFRNIETTFATNSGSARCIRLSGLPLIDDSGDLSGYRGTAVDVSVARQAEALLRDYNDLLRRQVAERTRDLQESHRELAAKERHLQVLLTAVPVGVLEIDNDQRCRFINTNGGVLTGWSTEEALGRRWLDFVHDDDRAYVEVVWTSNHQSEDIQWLEFRLARNNLRCMAHWINLASAAPALGNGAVMVLANATARSQNDARLWSLAHHDALTELPNRNLFHDRLGQAMREARRRSGSMAVLWIDLDGFKAVNDEHGHTAGDALLRQAGQRMIGRLRDSDTLARMGGDEFAVIVPDVGYDADVLQIATTLAACLAEPFRLAHGQIQISASIGVALYPLHADTAERLVQCADMAMYDAKNAGKNRVQVWATERVLGKPIVE